MTNEEFNYFRSKIYSLAGISLSDAKRELLQTRLKHRLQALSLDGFERYKSHLETLPEDHHEWELFINLLTTNKTEWFREPAHFMFIVEEFLPKWLKLKKSHLSVWCAASSTGEEPYTLSLILNEHLKNSGITYNIIATDIDTKVLAHAKNGVYPASRLEQIPEEYRAGFCVGKDDLSSWMKVRKDIKSKVEFLQLNLNNSPYHMPVQFDLVLCRNVLIYFNKPTITKVTDGIYDCTSKDAVLLIAHSESLQNLTKNWKFVRPSIYQKGKLI